jgi:hypothetical protein
VILGVVVGLSAPQGSIWVSVEVDGHVSTGLACRCVPRLLLDLNGAGSVTWDAWCHPSRVGACQAD